MEKITSIIDWKEVDKELPQNSKRVDRWGNHVSIPYLVTDGNMVTVGCFWKGTDYYHFRHIHNSNTLKNIIMWAHFPDPGKIKRRTK